MNIKDKF